MFRIERTKVNLKSDRTVILNSEADEAQEVDGDQLQENNVSSSMGIYVDPQELIDNAKKEAEQIVALARSESADLLLASKEEAELNARKAWDEGFSNGVEEGKSSYDHKMQECEESLKRVISELYEERTNTFSNLENEIVDLSLKIVRKVINPADEEISIFESLIKNALRQIAPDDKIMLRVSPEDYERYFSEGSAIFDLGNDVTVSASILKDMSLEKFDCIIDKDDSTVNAGLDTQLRYVQLAFSRR